MNQTLWICKHQAKTIDPLMAFIRKIKLKIGVFIKKKIILKNGFNFITIIFFQKIYFLIVLIFLQNSNFLKKFQNLKKFKTAKNFKTL